MQNKTNSWLLPLSLMKILENIKTQKKEKNQSCPKTLNKDFGEANMSYLVPRKGKKFTSCCRGCHMLSTYQ